MIGNVFPRGHKLFLSVFIVVVFVVLGHIMQVKTLVV